jgi:hypothetical protein
LENKRAQVENVQVQVESAQLQSDGGRLKFTSESVPMLGVSPEPRT